MWGIVLQFIWKIVKDPKLLAILALSILLAGSFVRGEWYKKEAENLKRQVIDLTTQVKNLQEVNKKITQNRDALAQQLEDYKGIDSKYKSLQERITALQKTCAVPIKPVVVSPKEGVKPVEKAPGAIVGPGGVTTPLPETVKPEEPKESSGEGVKMKTPEPEYQYGGWKYENDTKAVYNDIILWFNSNSPSGMLPKGSTASMPDTQVCLSGEANIETVGFEQNLGSPG